jgi:hypothetical protein
VSKPTLSFKTLAALFGVKRLQVIQLRHTGISLRNADRYAVKAGFHPSSVWGIKWWKYDQGDSSEQTGEDTESDSQGA